VTSPDRDRRSSDDFDVGKYRAPGNRRPVFVEGEALRALADANEREHVISGSVGSKLRDQMAFRQALSTF